MKSVLAVVILTLTLAVSASASAGQIQTPGAVSSGGGTTPVSTSVIVAVISLIYG